MQSRLHGQRSRGEPRLASLAGIEGDGDLWSIFRSFKRLGGVTGMRRAWAFRDNPGLVRMHGVEVRLRPNGLAGLVREVADGRRAAA